MEKCKNCPLKNDELECPAISRNHIRFCELADPENSAYNKNIHDILMSLNDRFVDQIPFDESVPIPQDSDSVKLNVPIRKDGKPNIVDQAKNIGVAAIRFIQSGMMLASEDVVRERLEICNNCSHFDKIRVKCNICGCFLAAKVKLASESCPISRWQRVDIEQ